MLDFDKPDRVFESIDDFTLESLTGRFDVKINGIIYPVYFPNPDINLKKLYVSLSGGARTNNNVKFDRWSWRNDLNGNLICIEDPMYKLFPNVFIGWYFGTANESFHQAITCLIRKIIQIYDVQRLVFLGSSASGFAVTSLCSSFSNSLVLALNPQFDIKVWKPWTVARFENETKIQLSTELKHRFSVVNKILRDHRNNYFFYFNLKSEWDRRQAALLCNIPKDLDKPKIIRQANRTFFFASIDWPDPHTTYLDRWDLQVIERALLLTNENLSEEILRYVLLKNQDIYSLRFAQATNSIKLNIISKINIPSFMEIRLFDERLFLQLRFKKLDPRIHFEITILDFKLAKIELALHIEIENYLNEKVIENIDKILVPHLFKKIKGHYIKYRLMLSNSSDLISFFNQNFIDLANRIYGLLE